MKFHPAIQAVKEVSGYYPPKVLFEEVIKAVGDKPDVERMRRVFKRWVAKDYNPRNLDGWLFDWYAKRGDYYTTPQAIDDFLGQDDDI